MLHTFSEVITFQIREGKTIIFIEDIYGNKVLADNRNLSAMIFEDKASAQHRCNAINALNIHRLRVSVSGFPYTLVLDDLTCNVTNKALYEFQTYRFQFTMDTELSICKQSHPFVVDYLAAPLYHIYKNDKHGGMLIIHIDRSADGGTAIQYLNCDGDLLYEEVFSKIPFKGSKIILHYTELVLMLDSEYEARAKTIN